MGASHVNEKEDSAIAPITSLKIGNSDLFKTLPGKLYEPPLLLPQRANNGKRGKGKFFQP